MSQREKTKLFRIPSDISKIDPRFETCLFLVEASDFEMDALRKNYTEEPLYHRWREKGPWISDPNGFAMQIAELDGRPLMVSFSFATVCGVPLLFYHNSSQLIDRDATERFIDRVFKRLRHDGDRWSQCNPLNFAHFLRASDELRLKGAAMQEQRALQKSTPAAQSAGPRAPRI